MKAVKKILVSMELHLDASIDKLDNLAMNVQIDKEKHTENEKKQEQTEPEMWLKSLVLNTLSPGIIRR